MPAAFTIMTVKRGGMMSARWPDNQRCMALELRLQTR
jgi:hypothetical protein